MLWCTLRRQLVQKMTPKTTKPGTKNDPCFGYGFCPRAPAAYQFMERVPKNGPENVPQNGAVFLNILAAFFLRRGWPVPPVSAAGMCRLGLPCEG